MQARTYHFDEVDRSEEVAMILTNLRQEVVNEVDVLQTQIDELRSKVTKKKAKGFSRISAMILAVIFAVVFCSVSQGIAWRWEYGTSPYLLDAFMRDPEFPNLEMDTLTLANGMTIDNATNNIMEWNENSEGLLWTFNTNQVSLSTDTGILDIDFGALYITMEEISTPSGNPSTNQGWIYVADNGGTTTLYFEDSAGTATNLIAAGSGNTLDQAYDQGGAGAGGSIDVDTAGVTLTVSDTDDNAALILAQNDATNDPNALYIVMGANSTGQAILINSQTSGTDIQGDNWNVNQAGAITAVSLDISGSAGLTLQNDETILNDVDNEIEFASATEDISFGLATSNTLTLTSDTAVDTIAFGDLDAFTGVNTIAMDAAASSISLTSDGDADDFTISVAGATDSSLVLSSSGTGADAMQINATAGGIDLNASSAAAGEDIDITATGSSVNVTATENTADSIVLSSSNGGIDITAAAAAAGEDIDISSTGSSINITASEAIATAIVIDASNAAGGMDIDAGSGNIDIDVTGGDFTVDNDGAGKNITFDATAGSVYIDGGEAAANAIVIDASHADGGIDMDCGTAGFNLLATAGDVTVTNTSAKDIIIDAQAGRVLITGTESAADAIILTADGANGEIALTAQAGGLDFDAASGDIDITAAGAATDNITITNTTGTSVTEDAGAIQLTATAGGIQIQSDGDLDDAVVIRADGGTTAEMTIHNDQGDQEDSIEIISDAGGIDITCATGKNLDLTGGQITLLSNEDAASAIALTTNTGSAETIVVTNTQGTDPASIALTSTAGGITMTADAATAVGRITLASLVSLGAASTFGAADATPDISGSSYWETGGAVTITDFDAGGGTIPEGTVIIVQSLHAVTFDVTASGLTGGTADLVTASGDQTCWVYNAAGDWVLISFTDMSDDLS